MKSTISGNAIAYQPNKISQISHELRIPLTGILGMTYFLGKTRLTSEQETYLKNIRKSANSLLHLEEKIYALLKETSSTRR